MIKKYFYSFVLTLITSLMLMAAVIEVPQEILNGFREGKAEAISAFFNESVELTIDNKENIYSSTQAQLILKDFFKKNTPQSFAIIHEGGKGESKYAIGTLKTNNGSYRITMLLKQANNAPYIHQLRIEKDEI